jgi:hypothetical protein
MPKLKVVTLWSCWYLLTVGFCTATHAADTPLAPERATHNLHAHTKMENNLVKPKDATRQEIKTIKGEVFRVKGQHVYLRRADGKEIHLHTKSTTEMKKEPKKGDDIEVEIDDEGNALSIR